MRILTTERLYLEEATLEDAHFFFELLNSPTWIQYIGDRGIKTLSDAEHYIRDSLIASYRSRGFGLYKMIRRNDEKPLGVCGLLKRDRLEHPDVGFAILPEFQRNGYTLEAVVAMMDHAFQRLGFDQILAFTTEENQGSQKVLEKAGLFFDQKVHVEENGPEFLLYKKASFQK